MLIAEVSGVDRESANLAAFRVWTSLHGIVSLRLHKVHAPWPTSIEDDVRAVIDDLVSNPDHAVST